MSHCTRHCIRQRMHHSMHRSMCYRMRHSMRQVGVLLVLSLLVPACPAQRRTLSREALLKSLEEIDGRPEPSLPTLAELHALRVPAPAPLDATLRERALAAAENPQRFSPLERARLAIAVRGDVAEAERAWSEGAKLSGPQRADLLAHRCLVEESLRRYPELLSSCAAFLDEAPEDPRAPALALVIGRARSAFAKAEALLVARYPAWLEGCRARRRDPQSCADLAWVLASAATDGTARAKDEEAAKAAVDAGGWLRAARVVGPFEDAERFAYGMEGKPFEPRAIAGKTHERTRTPWDGRFAPAERGQPGLYQLVFDVEGGGDVTFFVSGRHALRLVVDGVTLLERRPLLREEPFVSRVGAELSPGPHRVIVLTHSHGTGDGLSIAVLDRGGRAALHARRESGQRAAGVKPQHPLPGAFEVARASSSTPDLAALDAYLVSWELGRSGLGVPPSLHRDEVRTLLETWGFAPQVLVAAATSVSRDPTVPARLATADAAPLWARLDDVWPGHPVALVTRARALKDERPEEALDAFRSLVAERPGYPFGQRELVALSLERGLIDEALSAARALLDREVSPENIDAALPALRRAGALSEAAGLERRRAKLDDALYGAGWARYLLGAGRTEEAIVELERICEGVEGHPAEEALLDLLSLERPASALERVERLLHRYPNDASMLQRHIELLAHGNGSEAARRAAELALVRAGANGELQLLFEELGGEPVWWPRLAAGDAALAARRARKDEPFAGHPIVMLVDRMERHLMHDLSSVEVRHWIAELKSEDALDGFGELHVSPSQRLLRIRVLKPDGRVLEPEHPPGVEDVSLTGLGIGDIVEMLTVSYQERPATGGMAFETFLFSSRAPALERSYLLSLPKALSDDPSFRVLHRAGAPAPVERAVDGGERTELLFQAGDVAARIHEPHAPPDEEHGALVGYAFDVDAPHWALYRGRDSARAAKPDPWLALAARRIAGEGSTKERLERLFRFVIRRIEPAPEPVEATQVLASGRGDRTVLLLALSRALGLPVDPVALHVPIAPPLDVPTTRAFAVIGVRTRLSEGPSFAFVDGQMAVLDGLPPLARGAEVLDLTLDEERAERTSLLPESAVSQRPVKIQLDLEWGAPGKLQGLLALNIPPYLAENVRRGLRQASSAQLSALFEQALGESLPGVHVEDVRVPHLDAPGLPLGIGVSLAVPLEASGVEPVRFERLFAQGASSSLGLFTAISSYLRIADRRQPLLVIAAAEELEVELTLPPGAAFTEAPEKLEITAGPFALSQRATVTDGTLYWSRKLSSSTARVSPEEWRTLRTMLAALAGQTEARIAFVVPSG